MALFSKFLKSARSIIGNRPLNELTVGRVTLIGGGVGLGAMGLGFIGGPTSAHGGQGFPESGIGPVQRKLMTDFGSGYQGDSGPGWIAPASTAVGAAGAVGASAMLFPFQSAKDLEEYPRLAKLRAAGRKGGFKTLSAHMKLSPDATRLQKMLFGAMHGHMQPTALKDLSGFKGALYIQSGQWAADQLPKGATVANFGNWSVGADKLDTWKYLQSKGASSLHAKTLSAAEFYKAPGKPSAAGLRFLEEVGGAENIVVKTTTGVRGEGVWLNANKLPEDLQGALFRKPKEFLFQQKLNLKEEFRVVTAGGKPIHTTYRFGSPLARRLAKKLGYTPTKEILGTGKVGKVSPFEVIQPVINRKYKAGVEAFARKVAKTLPYDIGALDIGMTKDGKFTLIEAQRSFGNISNSIVSRRIRQTITGKFSKLEMGLVGAAAIVGGVLGWGAFSGKDDEYNVIEGLPEKGMAGARRKLATDFGSGYRGQVGAVISKLAATQLSRLRYAWKATTSKSMRAAIEGEAKLVRELEAAAGKTRVPPDITAIQRELNQIWQDPLSAARHKGLERWKVKNLFKRAEKIGKKPLGKQNFDPLKQGPEKFMPSGAGLSEAAATTNPAHFSKTLRVMREAFQETTTPFTKGELSGIKYMLQRSKPEVFAGVFGMDKAVVKGFRQHAANIMTRNVNLKSGAVEGVKFDEVVNALIFRQAAKSRIGTALTGATKTSSNINMLTAVQEEFVLRSEATKPLWTMFGQNRQINPKHTWSWFSGSDDAWNTIEGFQERGISPELRKIITDFGSGWDPVRALARSLGMDLSTLTRSSAFKKALLSGKLVKGLGSGTTASAELMEGVFKGNTFQYVRKSLHKGASSNIDEFMSTFTQGTAATEVKIGARLQKIVHPDKYDIAPSLYGYSVKGPEKQIQSLYQEYIQGPTMFDAIKSKTMTVAQKQKISDDLKGYLSYIKQQGITHGDVIPANIIVTPKSPTGFSMIDWGGGSLRKGERLIEETIANKYANRATQYMDDFMGMETPRVLPEAVASGANLAQEASRASAALVQGGFAPAAPELRHIASTMPKAIAAARSQKVPTTYMKQNTPLSTKVKIKGTSNRGSNPGALVSMVSANVPRSKVNISVKDQRSKLTPQAISDMMDR